MTHEELCRMEQSKLIKLIDEGKLIYLPCKRGDKIYSLLSPPNHKRDLIYEYKVVFIGINDSKDVNVRSVKGDWMYQFNFSEIGKTAFLTREEAEKALKERENNG